MTSCEWTDGKIQKQVDATCSLLTTNFPPQKICEPQSRRWMDGWTDGWRDAATAMRGKVSLMKDSDRQN